MKRIHIVAGIIFNQDKSQIFITKRPDNLHKGGFWNFPVAKSKRASRLNKRWHASSTKKLALK